MSQTPHWPPLFRAIIENDAAREALRARPAIPFREYVDLMRERASFRIAAQTLLRWNPNPTPHGRTGTARA